MKKFVSLFLAIDILINPMMVRVAFAEESIIVTGDAQADSQTDTTANISIDTLPGEITTGIGSCTPPEGQTSCPEDIVIVNDNLAVVETQTDAIVTTGVNQITDSAGDATISTGDASASGNVQTQININEVVLEPTVIPSPSPDLAQSPEQPESLSVVNENSGQVENQAAIIASTGDNLASDNLGDASIQTGDSTAIANILNVLNLNVIGSNFEVLMLDLTNGQSGDIDLNEIWKQLLLESGDNQLQLADGVSTNNLTIMMANENQANLENNIDLTASTGNNQANDNSNSEIQTGDATALVNVTNIVNANLLGSKFFLGVINIFNYQDGDLILPRLERFLLDGVNQNGNVVINNENVACINDTVNSTALTGQNTQKDNSGSNTAQTGNAQSQANDFTLANLDVQKNNWFFLMVNRLGNWSGQMIGFRIPSAGESQTLSSQIYQFGLGEQVSASETPSQETLSTIFQNDNQARISNNIQTTADTGNNQAVGNQGDSLIKTGNARSVANVFNLVNLNILGGRWFMGVVNIMDNWKGNIVFAYPDLIVNISDGVEGIKPGDNYSYDVSYKNQGQDEAQGVTVELDLPNGVNYLSDTSGLVPTISGQHLQWFLGNVGSQVQKSFQVMVQLKSDFTGDSTLGFLERFLPIAYAAENDISIVAGVSIKTIDPESNTNNNQSSDTTIVNFPTQNNDSTPDSRQPVLEITAKNNVNDFVYKGDTVTFEVTVKNTGDVSSYNTHLTQKLYNGASEDFGTFEFDLGTIEPGKGGTLTFGLKLANDGKIPADNYRTIAQVYGKAPNGDDVSSNEARTDFKLIEKLAATFFEAKAAEKSEVLGNSTLSCPPKEEDIMPYVLLFMLSSLYITTRSYGKKV